MNLNCPTSTRPRFLVATVSLLLAASGAMAQQPATPDAATLAKYDKDNNGRLDAGEVAAMEDDQKKSDTVTLSPFEVQTDTKGYYSANSMSGTRFNSKIEDLASAISVVTKEQMSDFAMLDINDVFLYTAGTEGTGTYTDYSVDRNGSVSDNVQLNPTQANRVRGIAAANVSFGNFETQGRTPVDPLAIDGVEVSRGPNANVFGLGSPAGTVNQVPSSANLTRNRASLGLRGDSVGGYRTSLDVNQVLFKDKLAIRASGAFQHDAFQLKPSGTNTVRYNGMVKYQPFKNTTISGSVLYYRLNGNRPNASPPRDNVSYWLASGKPTWDPVTQQVHLNGATVGTFPTATGLPDYFANTFTGSTRGQVFVDGGTVGYWTTPTSNAGTTPNAGGQAIRFVGTSPAPGASLGKITTQPLFTTTPTVSNKALYDYESVNIAATNRIVDRSLTSYFQVDQVILNTPMQTLVAQAAFFREDSQRYARNLIGSANDNGQSGQLTIDVNERLLDGTPNPYFLRPFIGTDQPRTTSTPAKWDTYRAQVGYKIDLTQEKGWVKWLGLHQFTGYDEYKYRIQRNYSFRDAMSDSHSWIPAGTSRGNQGGALGATRGFFRYYVGDRNGSNVDYAPTNFNYGNYTFVWGDGLTGVFNREPAVLSQVAVNDSAGAGNNTKTILKTMGSVVQSHFLSGSLVTTFGLRQDEVYSKTGSTPVVIAADGISYDYAAINHWIGGDYRFNTGKTKTAGAVFRPFRELSFMNRLGESRGAGMASAFLRGLSFSYNYSDSFTPQNPAQDLYLKPLPNSTGEGKDYGFTLNLADGKFVLRVNHYINKQLNARNGDANTIAQRVLRQDVSSADAFQLHNRALDWVTAQNPTFTADQLEAEVARQIGLTVDRQLALRLPVVPIAATNDIVAVGTEIELNFNPTRFWTVSGSVTDSRSTSTNISSAVAQYIAERTPIWNSVQDPRGPDLILGTPDDRNIPWRTTNYGGSQTAAQNFATFVETPYSVIRQQEGKSSPQIRRYAARFSSNFQMAGITDNKLLKRFNVGGAVRWEDKGAIGYYGLQKLPATITDLDPSRPIYDKGHYYFDAFIGYRQRILRDRVGMTVQFNVRNIQESGRLQAIGAYPDGTPHSYRIVDPRLFVLQTSFDL